MINLLLVQLCALKRVASPKHGFGYERLATSHNWCTHPTALKNHTPLFCFLSGATLTGASSKSSWAITPTNPDM